MDGLAIGCVANIRRMGKAHRLQLSARPVLFLNSGQRQVIVVGVFQIVTPDHMAGVIPGLIRIRAGLHDNSVGNLVGH
ncbi:MAG: hypothetical protein WAV70_02300, partial [Anaerolineae bacterium]